MRPVRLAIVEAAAVAIGAALTCSYIGRACSQGCLVWRAVAVANTLLLVWRMRAGAQLTGKSPGQELAGLVRFSLERFFMVALLIAAGLGWLKLMPAPLLIGFVLGQLALVVSTILSGIEK